LRCSRVSVCGCCVCRPWLLLWLRRFTNSRAIGQSARDHWRSNLKNTITDLVRLTGASESDYRAVCPEPIFELAPYGDSQRLGVAVDFLGKRTVFPTEHVTGMLLRQLYSFAATGLANDAERAVYIALPSGVTAQQRQAIKDAASLAGLPAPVQVVDAVSAMAAAYLVKHVERLPGPEAPMVIMFLSVGHTYTTVGVVSISTAGARVLASACDANLGGANMDTVLVKYCAEKLLAEHSVELNVASKQGVRVLSAVRDSCTHCARAHCPRVTQRCGWGSFCLWGCLCAVRESQEGAEHHRRCAN